MARRIDAHHHLWDRSQPFDYTWQEVPALAPICRNFLPEDLQPCLEAAGIDGSIVVQTQHRLAENDWALNLAQHHPFIAGVVGWVDLASPDCEAILLPLLSQPKFVGIRHVTQEEPDDDFIVRPDIQRGLKVLEKHRVPFDLLFFDHHLHHVPTLARACPELPLVINHLSKPPIKAKRLSPWREELAAAARFPNVYCKLSGLITEADWRTWQPGDLRPYVEHALAVFGPERCLFGSDWPVCLLAGSYSRVHETLLELIAALSPREQDWVLGETAVRFYHLEGGRRA